MVLKTLRQGSGSNSGASCPSLNPYRLYHMGLSFCICKMQIIAAPTSCVIAIYCDFTDGEAETQRGRVLAWGSPSEREVHRRD